MSGAGNGGVDAANATVVIPSTTPVAQATTATGQTLQVLLVIPVLFIFVVIFFGFTGSRSERRRKDIKDIRSRTARRSAEMHVNPLFVKARILEAMSRETERCVGLKEEFEPDPKNPMPKGWGAIYAPSDAKGLPSGYANGKGGNSLGVGDLKMSVAGSISSLQKRFVDNTPGAAADVDSMPPREFIAILTANYPNLEANATRQYLRMYEFARFGRSEVPELAHTKFFKKLLNMITLISYNAEDDD